MSRDGAGRTGGGELLIRNGPPESVAALARWIDGLVGHVSDNTFFEVNVANAIGLSATTSKFM